MQGLSPTPVSQADSSRSSASTFRGQVVEGRAQLPSSQASTGQVVSSEANRDGQGYRVQVQLTSGEQLTLKLDRPLQEGQQLQLMSRNDGQVDLKLLPTQPHQQALAQRLAEVINQLPSITARPPSSSPALPLNPGQAQIAQVISSQTQTAATSSQPGNNQLVTLQLANGQRFEVLTSQALNPGQQLQVSRPDASNTLQLTPFNQEASQLLSQLQTYTPTPPSLSRNEAASLQSLLQAASAQLRRALPRQAPLNQTLQQLSQLAPQLPRETANTPTAPQPQQPTQAPGQPRPQASLQAHLGQLLKMIPQGSRTPTAQQLQNFIPFSGLLLEAAIARGSAPSQIQADLKFLLQQASSQLRAQTPAQAGQQQLNAQLGRQLDAAQARIQVLQQNSLQATQVSHERGQPAQILQMDLPYSVRGDWFQAQLEIRRWIEEKDAEATAKQAARKTRSWEVRLSFDLEAWGKVHTRLKLKAEHLKADVWVEAEQSWEPVRAQVALLEARLRRLGAEVETVECHLGQPPETFIKRPAQQMIDTEV